MLPDARAPACDLPAPRMSYRLAADGVLLLHAAFILFVVFGGLLVWRWPRMAWLHVPAALWGAFVELSGGSCPLTAWENAFLAKAGLAGYGGGFVEHYLLGAIYPAGLTRTLQLLLGGAVVAVNLAVYGLLMRRRR
jgi:hypothetical protein